MHFTQNREIQSNFGQSVRGPFLETECILPRIGNASIPSNSLVFKNALKNAFFLQKIKKGKNIHFPFRSERLL